MRVRSKVASALFVAFTMASIAFPRVPPQQNAPGKPKLGGTLRVKPFNDVFRPSFDPAVETYFFLLEQLYDGLVRLDKNFNIIPSLAEYWVISEGGKKFTFYLRKGVKFHHGRELTSDDVKFSLERLVQKKTGLLYYQYFITKVAGAEEFREGKSPGVAGFKALGRYTFEIDWTDPYVSGLYLLSMSFCKVLPKELVESQGKGFFGKPSGTGAFKFGYWLRDSRLNIIGIRLERNDDYFDELPYLDAVEYSPSFTLEQFMAGNVHVVPLRSDSLASAPYQVLENDSLDIVLLGMSCSIGPLDRKDVRQALALALDKSKIAQAALSLESTTRVIDNYIPPDLPGFFPLEGAGGADLEKARRLLAEAGFPAGQGFPDLSIYFTFPRGEAQNRLFREIRDRLEDLGIRPAMKYFRSLEELKSVTVPHLVIIEWLMDYPDAENIIFPLFQSRSLLNKMYMGYSNSVLDRLLGASEIESSWEKRIELFRQMERILLEDVPAVPLYRIKRCLAVQPFVRGVKAPPLGNSILDVRDVWLDK
jgi:ABC-type transport system substrate-binding protein